MCSFICKKRMIRMCLLCYVDSMKQRNLFLRNKYKENIENKEKFFVCNNGKKLKAFGSTLGVYLDVLGPT